jgi:primosomal protein N' (replication factor Y)
VSLVKQPSLFAPADLPENLTKWEQAEEADRLYAEVVFNRPLMTVFHYLVPEELRERIGPARRVEAPFGARNERMTGFCVGITRDAPQGRTIKSLAAVLDAQPLIDAHLLELTRWIADRYLCGWGQVLDAVIPAGVKSRAGTRDVVHFHVAEAVRDQLPQLKLPPKQRAVLEVLLGSPQPIAVDQLSQAANCGVGPIHALRDRGLIVAERVRTMTAEVAEPPVEPAAEITLNVEQQRALDALLEAVRAAEHQTFLLHGVTGSGKTEVYIRAIEEVVSYGRQAIVLVPEISLTPQTIRRFRRRFSAVAVLHSHMTDVERHAHWKRIADGQVQVVVGARSAVFAPTPHLGLIVIDEEHETSFKQESTPRYHAREVARRRAELERVPLVLGSATPTLESWLRVQQRQDRLLSLPRRVAGLPLPPVVIVDTRDDPQLQGPRGIGRALQTAMHQALRDYGQIILFLNLRGYAPVLLCHACGHAVRCPDCDLTLTWHKQRGRALCHTCGYETETPQSCPRCRRPGLRHFGIGTERLEHEVRTQFPTVNALRMDSDTMQARGSHDAALESFRRGDVRILLGTQMIAKGLDFPNVTLVGVIDADTSLRQPDLRARERTFQLIAQVAGRTGRGRRPGRVFVQTCCPDDPAIQHAARHDYLGFANEELEQRAACQAPPFQSAARVILRGRVEADVAEDADTLATLLRQTSSASTNTVRVLGPAPCPIARSHGQFRYHLQMLAADTTAIQAVWVLASPNFSARRGVELAVDVDPLSLR